MKKVLLTFCALISLSVMVSAQEQSGIPAKITAVNGKEFPVFLQRIDGENIVFQLYKSTENKSVPVRLISEITFVGRYDVDGAEQLFATGDYMGMINKLKAEMKPSLDEHWQYMVIENNLQDLFTMLMKAYLRLDNVAKASEAAEILLQNGSASVKGQAESIAILSALGQDRIADAQEMLEQIASEPGKLYLGACVERAKGNPVEAIKQIVKLISEHGNNLNWMPQAELLNAHLYMDMGLTNSAIATARQVKNIYANSDVGNDAARLFTEYTLAKQQADAAAKARADAEAARIEAVRARAQRRAQGYGFLSEQESDDTNTVDQAEDEGAVENVGEEAQTDAAVDE